MASGGLPEGQRLGSLVWVRPSSSLQLRSCILRHVDADARTVPTARRPFTRLATRGSLPRGPTFKTT